VAFSVQGALRLIYGTRSAGRKTKIKRTVSFYYNCVIVFCRAQALFILESHGKAVLQTLVREHKSEYLTLSNEEQVELLTKFTEWKETKKTGVHVTVKSKINDITQTLKAVENEVCSLLHLSLTFPDIF
jgi:hypothetical protein